MLLRGPSLGSEMILLQYLLKPRHCLHRVPKCPQPAPFNLVWPLPIALDPAPEKLDFLDGREDKAA